jgi:hypothetical protein
MNARPGGEQQSPDRATESPPTDKDDREMSVETPENDRDDGHPDPDDPAVKARSTAILTEVFQNPAFMDELQSILDEWSPPAVNRDRTIIANDDNPH